MKHIILALLLLPISHREAIAAPEVGRQTIQIAGTEYERLQSVQDMLGLLPGVMVTEKEITVIGRGTPAIYIDGRRARELSELRHILGNRVKEIEVFRHPGAEYEKDVESVIVIRLKPDEAEGLALDNTLRLNVNPRFSPINDFSLRWRRGRFGLKASAGWKMEQRNFTSTSFTNTYHDGRLIKEERTDNASETERQELSLRLAATYQPTPVSRLSAQYALLDRYTDHEFQPNTQAHTYDPQLRHDFVLEGVTRLGDWTLSFIENAYIDHPSNTNIKPTQSTHYIRKEYDLRTRIKADRPLWHGTLSLGVQHEIDCMDVLMSEDSPSFSDIERALNRTHATAPEHTVSAFATTSQELAGWKIEAGLRYDHRNYSYRPCDDDGLMYFLAGTGFILPDNDYITSLLQDGRVRYTGNYLYPSLKIARKVGASDFLLKHTENSVRPYLGISRLRYQELEHLDDKLLLTERTSTTSLEWCYRWLHVTASHYYFDDPICQTMSSKKQYNTTDYHAMSYSLTLSPRIGWWTPMLHATLYKQWLGMTLARGDNGKLQHPYGTITWNNTLCLPHDWTVRLNGQWHSRGAERNFYHFSTDFCLDASVQKTFPRQHLTIDLTATNLLGGSYYDITRYTQAYNGVSEGKREPNPRVFSLSLRWWL